MTGSATTEELKRKLLALQQMLSEDEEVTGGPSHGDPAPQEFDPANLQVFNDPRSRIPVSPLTASLASYSQQGWGNRTEVDEYYQKLPRNDHRTSTVTETGRPVSEVFDAATAEDSPEHKGAEDRKKALTNRLLHYSKK